MHPANAISIFRIIVLPLIIYFLSLDTLIASFLALVLFGFAVFSDILDGLVIQIPEQKRLVGSFLDPLADKILIAGLLLFFAFQNVFSWAILGIFLLNDFSAAVFRFLSAREDIYLPVRKAYTMLLTAGQFALIFGLMVQDVLQEGMIRFAQYATVIRLLISVLAALTAVLALVSGLHSLFFFLRSISRKKKLRAREMPPEKTIILANRKSRGYHNNYRRRLLGLFAKRRGASLLYLPTHQKDMFEGMDELCSAYPRVIIAGGDGSFEGALNYPPFEKRTLGFFPLGAGNAFYSYFYKGKRYEYLRSRFPFREQEIDVVELEWENGRRQTLFVNIGLDAEVIKFSLDRTEHGLTDYLRGCWQAICKARSSYAFEVYINGKRRTLPNCSAIILGKIPYFGYGLRSLVGKVSPTDGKVYGLAIVNSHASLFNKPLRAWAAIISLFNVSMPPLFPFKEKEILIKSSIPFPLQAGGEYLGESTWVRLRVVRKQKVLVI